MTPDMSWMPKSLKGRALTRVLKKNCFAPGGPLKHVGHSYQFKYGIPHDQQKSLRCYYCGTTRRRKEGEV